ncbi:RND superfamily putative drug exporter [Kribbella orskensis]|uniref:RND superfamily putative drug exporter n=1 Tax=Kribbella orskensis TaxID=2512216 RepID=A0ABY2BRT0_9ACTN|nr:MULTISPECIES: MMPL family transporter [Kribbella]TCN39541.1 RND superfamily putative drug exporter [Kribbella sp. VKM Ac-2500]TCO27678.1 RND superfamily putative drug exporter [Kribbella orskensis]
MTDDRGRDRGGLLHRVSAWAMRHAGLAVFLWLLVLVGVTVGSTLAGNAYRDENSLPGTDSQRVIDVFREHQPGGETDSVQIVLHDEDGLTQPVTKSQIAGMLAEVGKLPRVAAVADPFTAKGSLSTDGSTAYATVDLDVAAVDMPLADVRTIIDKAQGIAKDGLEVEVGGDLARSAADSAGGAAEGAGVLAALVILVFLFGSLLAASLPLLTAVFAVGSTLGLLVLASHVFTIPSYTAPVMMLVGLGVGIDYALLIFSRYRSELLKGADRPKAGRIALDTAGRSVLFAGCTVVIALLGLLALGLGSLQGLALGVTVTVLMTMLAAVTLLPALLTLFGKRIERSVRKHAAKSRRQPGDGWRRLATRVQRGPWVPLVLGTLALVALCLPALDMRLGFADAGTDDPAKTSRKAYDLLAQGFGPGFNGPLIIVSEGDQAAAEALGRKLAADPGIAAVTPPQLMADGKVTTVMAFPKSAPQDEATSDLVHRLREVTLPQLAAETSATYLVGGTTAAADDFAGAVSKRLPIFVLVVVGLSALLLMTVFRSILIPLKAAVLNLLSIGASLGVITLVFQQGWFGAQQGPIEAFVPVMIFAIVFGLSMDYEVFLISRIHEEWRRTGDAREAVREGLANTGSVITAAAAIMIVVFGAFLLSPDRMLKQFGLGLAVAVLLDALLIRCVIVPAVLRLMGTRAWWLPRWLDRILPTIALEREEPVEEQPNKAELVGSEVRR